MIPFELCYRKKPFGNAIVCFLLLLSFSLTGFADTGPFSLNMNINKEKEIPFIAQNGNQGDGVFGVPERYRNQPLPALEQKQEIPPSEPPSQIETPASGKTDAEQLDQKSPPGDSGGAVQIPETGEIELNFDSAELGEVVRTLAEILNINYILDPNVRGQVTIQTAGSLSKEELWPVFFQILQVNGLTAVREGKIYKILPFKDAPRQPIDYSIEKSGRIQKKAGPDEQPIVQIIPLDYIDPEEMSKVLSPFVSAQGTIISHDGAQSLIVVDSISNIRKILNLVSAFDINFFDRIHYRFYPLKFANAANVADALRAITESVEEKPNIDTRFIPIERLNTLLVISSHPQAFSKIRNIIEELDAVPADTEPKIYIYFVKNGQAEELADLLNQVFSNQTASKKKMDSEKQSRQNPYNIPAESKTEEQSPSVESRTLGTETSAALGGDVQITPDVIRNALVIEATPRDYRLIENILNRLDVLPRQVLIEVTIAEISLTTSLELGVEWEYVKGPGDLSTSLLNANIGSAGLQYVVGRANRWSAALSALAKEDRVNILSSPTVLASDNKEAKIDISTEVPVASAQYQYTGETEPLLQTNIQYRNTGVILTVTPHINEFGLVSMDISQEVSEQSESVEVGNESLPSFFKRSVNTSLTVRHGQTIVIGGLIRENRANGRSGVPCLGGVPLFDWIFGKKTTSKDKTELIILITPLVINSLEDVDAVTEEFKDKVRNVIRQNSERPQ